MTLDFKDRCFSEVDLENLNDVVEGISISEEEGSVKTDKDHLRKNPECGILPEKSQTASASSRISNADETDKHYPWVISVLRRNSELQGHIGYCGGSIITQKTAVTASHCICGIPEQYASSIPEDMKWRVNCRGGINSGITSQPLNEVRESNEIGYRIGDKDTSNLDAFEIRVAYVMCSEMRKSSFQQSFSWHLFEDVGLVITKDAEGNGFTFYQHNRPTVDNNVGSVCLAAEIKNKPHITEGKIVTVGSGIRYSDVKYQGLPQDQKHSCATNEFGPIDAKFRHCSVQDLIGVGLTKWGCDRSDMPKGYDEAKCKKLLLQAEAAVNHEISKLDNSEVLSKLWSLTNKIEVSGDLINKQYICYKEKMFKESGWCYVHHWRRTPGGKEQNWGFCGSSCKLMQTQDTSSSIYHKMVYQYPPERPTNCPDSFYNNPDPNLITKPYYLCMASFLPQTSVFRFKRGRENNLVFQNADKENIEDTFGSISNYERKHIGYQQHCPGDSGSGHWMYDSKENKRALVGITSHSASDTETGKYCGVATHSLITTYPSVLQWIKRYSKIL